MNTGVSKGQIKDSNMTYNNSIFNPMYTFAQLQPNANATMNNKDAKENDVNNSDIVACSYILSIQDRIIIIVLLIL